MGFNQRAHASGTHTRHAILTRRLGTRTMHIFDGGGMLRPGRVSIDIALFSNKGYVKGSAPSFRYDREYCRPRARRRVNLHHSVE